MADDSEPSAEVAVRTFADTVTGLDLEGLEAVVDRNKQAVVETVLAIAEIRERRLYRETHSSFQAYALDRFGISISTAKRWADQGEEIRKGLDAEVNPQVSAARARAIPSQREVERQRAAGAKAGAATAEPIDAKATEVGSSASVGKAAPSKAGPAPSIAERVEQAFKTDSATAAEALVECKPVEARDWPPGLLKRLASWVEQAGKVDAARARVEHGPVSCPHPRARENKLPYGVFCGRCGIKLR